ncbi:unnamed protein product [Victoria cruziana]
MKRQKMQPTFILLIMSASLIADLSSNTSAEPKGEEPRGRCAKFSSPDCKGQPEPKNTISSEKSPPKGSSPPPKGGSPEKSHSLTPPPSTSAPRTPSPAPTTSPPPSTPAPRTPSSPPTTSPPSPALTNEQKKVGRVVGLLFLGMAGVLQVGVVSFLVFKRWQIPRIQDETGIRLVS